MNLFLISNSLSMGSRIIITRGSPSPALHNTFSIFFPFKSEKSCVQMRFSF